VAVAGGFTVIVGEAATGVRDGVAGIGVEVGIRGVVEG
jgi:hypothetical protein